VVGELRRGVELVRRRDDVSAVLLAAWLDSVVADYGDRILPVTSGICEQCARITVPDPLPVVDGLLAATAIEHDLVLVTRNVAGVGRAPVRVVNPFAA
jgi:predicted nucleic acid-binding protein